MHALLFSVRIHIALMQLLILRAVDPMVSREKNGDFGESRTFCRVNAVSRKQEPPS